jgi:hypothetical protein
MIASPLIAKIHTLAQHAENGTEGASYPRFLWTTLWTTLFTSRKARATIGPWSTARQMTTGVALTQYRLQSNWRKHV